MTIKSALYALAVVVLTGFMAAVASADFLGETGYGPAESSLSANEGMNEPVADAWELREAMETGALPDRPDGLSDAECCRGIDGPTIDGGAQSFRPEVDVGP